MVGGLQKLIDREPSMAAILPRLPGTKESRYAHLLCGLVEAAAIFSPPATPAAAANPAQDERMTQLEATVAELRRQLEALQEKMDSLFGA